MRLQLAALALRLSANSLHAQDIPKRYRADADRIIDAALKDSAAWNRLAKLTDTFGHRFSGSASLERAIDWTLDEMRKDGLDSVRGEPVMVTRWVRGTESLVMTSPRRESLRILGLGGSIGTPRAGITAPVLVVSSFDELTARGAEAKGQVVLFDVPFTTYGATVRYRAGAASAAAKVGAVAALVRSVTPVSLKTPHTGSMRYDTTATKRKIPAA